MKNKLLTFVAFFVVGLMQATAQATQNAGDLLMGSGKLYAVITVLVLILLGISIFLIRLDRKVSRLEQ